MARVRDFGRTRTLLITAANELFSKQGYDGTSVDRIIKQAGASKGAFYHHFSSKEEILDAVTASMVSDLMKEIRAAVTDTSAGAIPRLNRFLSAARIWKLAHVGLLREVLGVLHRDENATMLRKLEATTLSLCSPVLAEILRQGIDEGVFDAPNPQEVARLILQFSSAIQVDTLRTLRQLGLSEQAFNVLQARANLYIEMLERMVGAKKGSIERLDLSVGELRSIAWDRAEEASMAKTGAS